jgi:hypothetical protein
MTTANNTPNTNPAPGAGCRPGRREVTMRSFKHIREDLEIACDGIRDAVRDVDAAMDAHHAGVVFGMLNDRVRAAEADHAALVDELNRTRRARGY